MYKVVLVRHASDALLQNTLGQRIGDYIAAVAFSPDGQTLALGTSDGDIWLVTIADGTSRAVYQNPQKKFDEIFSLAYSPGGDMLAAGDAEGALRVFRISTGALLHTFRHTNYVRAVAFSPDGQRVISGFLGSNQEDDLKVWSVVTPSQ